MAISTYDELQDAVANWLARDDLTLRIPEFIALAEAKFNRGLRSNLMEVRSTATVDLASDEPEFIALPGDFQTMRRIRLNGVSGKPRLEFKSGAQADEYRYGVANVTGQPRYFTIMGDELELIPTPDSAYTLEMVYRANLGLSDSVTTNWLLTLAPDAYLYGALMESAPYIKEDARINTWSAGLKYAMDGLNSLAMDQAYGSGPLVMGTSGPTP
jgi:hypothetical protein